MTSPLPLRFFGRHVVRAAFVLAIFGWGVGFYGPPIYLHAVVERTGWPLVWVSAAVSLHFLSGVVVIANLPRLHARWGIPSVLVGGAVLTAAGVLGWASAAAPWQLFVAAVISGMGWVTMGAVTVNAVISPWFVRGRPKALATAYNGGTTGGIVFAPLWVALIAWQGFTAAALIVGALMVVVMALLGARVFGHTPQSLGQRPDGEGEPRQTDRASPAFSSREPLPGRRLWHDRAFQWLAAGMAVGLFGQLGLLAHLFSLLATSLGAQRASWVMAGATLCAMLGRLAAARAIERHDRRRVAAISYTIQAIGTGLLLFATAGGIALILLGVALVGAGLGNATYLPPMIAQSDFAAQDVPRVVALVVAIGQATYAFAPMLFGLLLAASGAQGIGTGTTLPFAAASAVLLAAAGCFFVRPSGAVHRSPRVGELVR